MARTKKKAAESDAPTFDYTSFLTETIDNVARRLNYDSDPIESATPMPTGLLVLDLLYGGGIRPGWYTHFGKEQSSKTTGALVIAANAIKAQVPLITFFDYEGSSAASMPYIQSILNTCGIKKRTGEVFGTKDSETGKWINPPIVRFHIEAIGERFFDFLSSVLRALPDKKMVNGHWWLIYEDNKTNKAKVGEFADPNMPKRYGPGLWVPAPNGELQALFIVDSYPAMNPEANDEEETDNSIALQARMFSKQLPRVKGRLMQKMVAVIGTNQLRDAPMVVYGPKENEPGGQALRYNSDVRCKFTPRSSGQPLWPKNFDSETGWEVERSVEFEGGRDCYRYIHLKTVKNKLSVPNRVGWLRIWTSDGCGNARGYDPVFDTLYYLYMTGQLVGRGRKTMKLLLDGMEHQPNVKWPILKKWILGSLEEKRQVCQSLGYPTNFDLRKFCLVQMRKGKGEELYVKKTQSDAEGDIGGEDSD